MKKLLALLLALVMVSALAACGPKNPSAGPARNPGTESPAPSEEQTPIGGEGGSAEGVARFAGKYNLYCEEKDMYCKEFIIDEDGTVHGVVENSGMTDFVGTVAEDGTITAEMTSLGGTMTGTVTNDLQVTAHFEARGSIADFVGGPL